MDPWCVLRERVPPRGRALLAALLLTALTASAAPAGAATPASQGELQDALAAQLAEQEGISEAQAETRLDWQRDAIALARVAAA